MRGFPKSKRVSWAPNVSLCQVKLFLSEDSPSQVGLGAQDHLQAKASWLTHPSGAAFDDSLPPGFEGGHSTTQWQIKASKVPVIKWRCPPRFVLNLTWEVVSGEASQEVQDQNERELRTLEAVYPRLSAIPQNPTLSGNIEDSDHQVPLVPITPIEDEDFVDASNIMGRVNFSTNLQPPNLVTILPAQCNIPGISSTPFNEKQAAQMCIGVEPDVVAAADAAFAAIYKSNEHRNMIDQELLIQILSNPKLMENLFADSGACLNTPKIPHASAQFVPSSDHSLAPVTLSDPYHLHMKRMEFPTKSPSVAPSSANPFKQPNGLGPGSSPNVTLAPPIIAPPVKDVNYYKSLIQQHGDERQETIQHFGHWHDHQVVTNQEHSSTKDSKPKMMKPCIFYNRSKGCRNGAHCAYQHDSSSHQRGDNSISEVQSRKRMKMDREISS